MTRIKALVCCCVAAACLSMVLAGCSSQQNYTPPEKTPSVASPVIGTEGTLRVGVNTSTPPLAGAPESSAKIVGIDVDIAAALADNLGLKLEIVDVGADPETALTENKVDVVMGVKQTDTEVKFWKSTPYLPTAVALFATEPVPITPTKTMTPSIAAQVASTSAWQVTNEYGDEALVPVNDLKSAFSDMAAGNAEYVAADAVIGTYAAHRDNFQTEIVALLQQPGGYCVGLNDSNAELKQAITDALTALSEGGMVSIIEAKWLGSALNIQDVPLTEGAKSVKNAATNSASGAAAANSAVTPTDEDATLNADGTNQDAAGSTTTEPDTTNTNQQNTNAAA